MSSREAEVISINQLMLGVEILSERDGGIAEAFVPVRLVLSEDVATDTTHVDELATSIRAEAESHGGTGQLSPILLGEVPGHDQFFIIDGFHRFAALAANGEETAYATIRPNCTLDDIYDLRILTATMHKSVQFARIVEWVNELWDRTEWAGQLDVAQAFGLINRVGSGKHFGVDPTQLGNIAAWIDDKCTKWHISSTTIYNHLSIAKIADPELVQRARTNKSGREMLTITPQHLGVIAKESPGQFDVQRHIANLIVEHRLTVPRTRSLMSGVRRLGTIDQVRQFTDAINWTDLESEYGETQRKAYTTEKAIPSHITGIEDALRFIGQALVRDTQRDGSRLAPEILLQQSERLRSIATLCLKLAEQAGSDIRETDEEKRALQLKTEEQTEAEAQPEAEELSLNQEIWGKIDNYWMGYDDELPELASDEELEHLQKFVIAHTGSRIPSIQIARLRNLKGILLKANGAIYNR